MKEQSKLPAYSALLAIITWGGLWGIFEATAGYLLHLLPVSVGWLVWYPVACFFMYNVYRATGRIWSVPSVGLLAAAVKLLNLFLPGRIDRVINPAVSILFEAVIMAAVLFALRRFFASRKKSLPVKALAIFCMNTGWRALYALYLLLLVPDWMREVSVISSGEALITFFIVHNLGTGLILFMAAAVMKYILTPIIAVEGRLSAAVSSAAPRASTGIKTAAAFCLLGGSIALGMLL